MKISSILRILGFCVAFSGHAVAGVEWDQTATDFVNGPRVDAGINAAAADFIFDKDTVIDTFRYWTMEFVDNSAVPPVEDWDVTGVHNTFFDGTINYNLFRDNGNGLPDDTGSILPTAGEFHNGWTNAPTYQRRDVGGLNIGDNPYLRFAEYTVKFADPITFLGGETYWLAINMGTSRWQDEYSELFWARLGDGSLYGNGTAYAFGAPYPFDPPNPIAIDWYVDIETDVAFQLLSTEVPVPAPLYLVLLGLAALAVRGKTTR